MKKQFLTLVILLTTSLFFLSQAQEKIILVNEGMWQTDNGRLTYFEDGKIVSNQWFMDINGYKLGDTPNDIIQINNNIIAIALNWSNIVQFINPQGEAVAATEDIPNNRKLATDGQYVYVTSYAHEVAINGQFRNFTKGYVAKIDVNSFQVVDAIEVGYEPEGIAYYDGYLFVVNSGGYAFQENHDYESTISVVDAVSMKVIRTIDTKQINLYGKVSQSGQYLCINSQGDFYYEVDPATIILDCQAVIDGLPNNECFIKLNYAATANCTTLDGSFYTIGSRYSYLTGEYNFDYLVINPQHLFATNGTAGVTNTFPGTIKEDISSMGMLYSIYINPYTGYIYATDAGAYTSAGKLYQWNPQGQLLGTYKTYINPAHFLALPPNGVFNSVEDIESHTCNDNKIYNLQGMVVNNPTKGHIYIKNSKKFIYQ